MKAARSFLLVAPSLGILAVFFVAPIFVLAGLALSEQSGGALRPTASYVLRLLLDPYYLGVTANTLLFALSVTVISLVIGYPVAYYIAKVSTRWKPLLLFLVVSPMLVGVIVRSFGWMVLFGSTGVINSILHGLGLTQTPVEFLYSWGAVTIAVVHIMMPFMILPISSSLENVDDRLSEAASTLGARPDRVFRYIVFPLSLPGVITGCSLVLSLTLGGFATILLLGGTNTTVLALLAYQYVNTTLDEHFASAIGLLLLIVALVVLSVPTLTNRYLKR